MAHRLSNELLALVIVYSIESLDDLQQRAFLSRHIAFPTWAPESQAHAMVKALGIQNALFRAARFKQEVVFNAIRDAALARAAAGECCASFCAGYTSTLSWALAEGDLDVIQQLRCVDLLRAVHDDEDNRWTRILRGQNGDTLRRDMTKMLTRAASEGHAAVVRALRSGNYPQQADLDALLIAAQRGYVDVTDALRDDNLPDPVRAGDDPHLLSDLCADISSHTARVVYALRRGPHPARADFNGSFALYHCVADGSVDAMATMVALRDDTLPYPARADAHPLLVMIATGLKRESIVDVIYALRRGPNPARADADNSFALVFAIDSKNGGVEVVRALRDGSLPNPARADRGGLLGLAVEGGQLDMVQELLSGEHPEQPGPAYVVLAKQLGHHDIAAALLSWGVPPP